jgi:hypothetical protein
MISTVIQWIATEPNSPYRIFCDYRAQMALSHSKKKKATYLNEIWVIQRIPVHLPVVVS